MHGCPVAASTACPHYCFATIGGGSRVWRTHALLGMSLAAQADQGAMESFTSAVNAAGDDQTGSGLLFTLLVAPVVTATCHASCSSPSTYHTRHDLNAEPCKAAMLHHAKQRCRTMLSSNAEPPMHRNILALFRSPSLPYICLLMPCRPTVHYMPPQCHQLAAGWLSLAWLCRCRCCGISLIVLNSLLGTRLADPALPSFKHLTLHSMHAHLPPQVQ